MNGRRRDQFNGIYPGRYTVGERKAADIPVHAEGPEGPIVVGRFPISKAADAEAQSKAYAALPDMIAFLRVVALHSGSFGSEAIAILKKAGAEE